ncbi:MAG: hypothetical protein ACRC7O_13850 [Fimbriiglobus sp.]
MASADELIAVVGLPVNSPTVLALSASDGLAASSEPDGWSVPQRAYLSAPAAGYALTHELGRITNAVIYAEPAEGFAAFPNPLPGGLSHGATRRHVLARFGTPERNGAPSNFPGLGPLGAWDRFAVDGVLVHFQYTVVGERVCLVSIMAADVAP